MLYAIAMGQIKIDYRRLKLVTYNNMQNQCRANIHAVPSTVSLIYAYIGLQYDEI